MAKHVGSETRDGWIGQRFRGEKMNFDVIADLLTSLDAQTNPTLKPQLVRTLNECGDVDIAKLVGRSFRLGTEDVARAHTGLAGDDRDGGTGPVFDQIIEDNH